MISRYGIYFVLLLQLITLINMFEVSTAHAGTPLVEFIQKPSSQQLVAPSQTDIVFYTLKNNTKITFPLSINTSSSLLVVNATGNTCGSSIKAYGTCVLPLKFTAPASSQTVSATINVNYQGRAPLQDTLSFNVNSSIACSLLSINDYQTSFCQQQYQNFIPFVTNVFNIANINVVDGQTLGGMIGIYQHGTNNDSICYISCGLSSLNGSAPDQQTMFELASVTKTFTASILGKKIYENSVDPASSVTPYLPSGSWLGQSYNLNIHEQPVTFQDLATFAGGVCFSDAPDVVITDGTTQKQSDFVMDINQLDPTSPTCLGSGSNVKSVYGGTAHLPTHNFYSNSSVGLLAQILMSVDTYSNMDESDFNSWICQHITAPLGMNMTNACLPSEATGNTCPQTYSYCNTSQWQSSHYASGYHITNGVYQLGDPFPFVPWAGAGNLRSNVADMVTFIKANLGVSDSVDPAVVDLIQGMSIAHGSTQYLPVPSGSPKNNIGSQSPLSGGQGFAWVCDPSSSNQNAICGKIGGHTNFRSFVGFNRAKQYGIVLLFNTGDLNTNGSVSSSVIPSVSDIGVNMINATN